jgi:hypothetical protein
MEGAKGALESSVRSDSVPLSAWVAIHFLGTLFAQQPTHATTKLAVKRSGLAYPDAGRFDRICIR